MLNKTGVAFVVAAAAMIVLASPVQADLIAYWSFDAATATDDSGKGHTGTLANGATSGSASGFQGTAMSLPNTTSVMSLGTPVDIGTSWTVSAWIKSPTAGDGYATLVRNSAAAYSGSTEMQVIHSSGRALGAYYPSSAHYSAATLANNSTWQHVVAVGTFGKTTFYINGAYAGQISYGSTSDIGCVGNDYRYTIDRRFASYIDEVSVFNVALSAGQTDSLNDLALAADYQYSPVEFNGLLASAAGGHDDVVLAGVTWRYFGNGSYGATGLIAGASGTQDDVVVLATGTGNAVGFAVVPEPATLGFLTIGGFGMIGAAIRRRRA